MPKLMSNNDHNNDFFKTLIFLLSKNSLHLSKVTVKTYMLFFFVFFNLYSSKNLF